MMRSLPKLREFQRKWMRARRAEYFNGKSCARCGSTNDLEMDHIDPATKWTHLIWSFRREIREAELAKCQALCHDCHQEKTRIDLHKMNVGKPHPNQQRVSDAQIADALARFQTIQEAARSIGVTGSAISHRLKHRRIHGIPLPAPTFQIDADLTRTRHPR